MAAAACHSRAAQSCRVYAFGLGDGQQIAVGLTGKNREYHPPPKPPLDCVSTQFIFFIWHAFIVNEGESGGGGGGGSGGRREQPSINREMLVQLPERFGRCAATF